jgi:hypothetical protein
VLAQSGDAAAAEALFSEGRQLMNQGNFAQACPKFRESQRLDPGVGTLLYLADCYEKTGSTASAWASFLEAASAARKVDDARREQVARDRASALEPKLVRLKIIVSADAGDLTVKRDDTLVNAPLFNSAIPVDPGNHVIEATAPGKKKWTQTVQVPPSGDTVEVTVPALEPESAASGPASTVSTDASSAAQPIGAEKHPNTLRIVGISTAFVGAVGVGVGLTFAIKSHSKHTQADALCPNGQCPVDKHDSVLALQSDSNSFGRIAVVGCVIGGAAIATGVTLWFVGAPSKHRDSTAASIEPWVGIASAGVRGRF